MSYSAPVQSYSIFSASPSSPSAFSMFSFSRSPRETHAMYEEMRDALRPGNQTVSEFGVMAERRFKRASSTPSFRNSLRKFFRL